MQMKAVNSSRNRLGASLALLILAVVLAGCATKPSMTAEDQEYLEGYKRREALRKSQETPFIAVGMTCFVHGKVPYIQGVFVQEFPTGQASPGMKGGNFNCGGYSMVGYRLPMQWRPGMKVKVRWNHYVDGKPTWFEQYTTIRYYEEPGTIYVHFFPNDQVRVVAANNGPESSIHPIARSVVEPPPEIE